MLKERWRNLTKIPMAFRILILDTETSGLPSSRNIVTEQYEKWPRIVQLGAILYKCPFEGRPGRILHRYSQIVKPDGWCIEPGAQSIHNISMECAEQRGVCIEKVLKDLDHLTKSANAICCHNAAFDIPVVLAEYSRMYRVSPVECRIARLPVICTMMIGKKLCKILIEKTRANGETYGYYKCPKLSEMYMYFMNREFNGKFHDALDDCEATTEILDVLVRDHVPSLRVSVPGLFTFRQEYA